MLKHSFREKLEDSPQRSSSRLNRSGQFRSSPQFQSSPRSAGKGLTGIGRFSVTKCSVAESYPVGGGTRSSYDEDCCSVGRSYYGQMGDLGGEKGLAGPEYRRRNYTSGEERRLNESSTPSDSSGSG